MALGWTGLVLGRRKMVLTRAVPASRSLSQAVRRWGSGRQPGSPPSPPSWGGGGSTCPGMVRGGERRMVEVEMRGESGWPRRPWWWWLGRQQWKTRTTGGVIPGSSSSCCANLWFDFCFVLKSQSKQQEEKLTSWSIWTRDMKYRISFVLDVFIILL